jgi:magnesium chelatase family protein
MAALAREEKYRRIYVPECDASEAALIPNLEVVPVNSLADLHAHLIGQITIPNRRKTPRIFQ